MNIILYKNSSDRRVKNKTITASYNITGAEIFSPCSILSPNLIIEAFSDVVNYNYCYVPEFNRYYYCSVVLDNHKAILNCSVDVLMSNDLSNINTIISRNENIRNQYIVDISIPVSAKRQIQVESFGNDIEVGTTYVLGVI